MSSFLHSRYGGEYEDGEDRGGEARRNGVDRRDEYGDGEADGRQLAQAEIGARSRRLERDVQHSTKEDADTKRRRRQMGKGGRGDSGD